MNFIFCSWVKQAKKKKIADKLRTVSKQQAKIKNCPCRHLFQKGRLFTRIYLISRAYQCPMSVSGSDLGRHQHIVQMAHHRANTWAKAKSVHVPRLCPPGPPVGTCPHYWSVIEQVVESPLVPRPCSWSPTFALTSLDGGQLLTHRLAILMCSTRFSMIIRETLEPDAGTAFE